MTNLPTLTGSEKQITWANDIRTEINDKLQAVRSYIADKIAATQADLTDADADITDVKRERLGRVLENYTAAAELLTTADDLLGTITSSESYINRRFETKRYPWMLFFGAELNGRDLPSDEHRAIEMKWNPAGYEVPALIAHAYTKVQ